MLLWNRMFDAAVVDGHLPVRAGLHAASRHHVQDGLGLGQGQRGDAPAARTTPATATTSSSCGCSCTRLSVLGSRRTRGRKGSRRWRGTPCATAWTRSTAESSSRARSTARRATCRRSSGSRPSPSSASWTLPPARRSRVLGRIRAGVRLCLVEDDQSRRGGMVRAPRPRRQRSAGTTSATRGRTTTTPPAR